MNKKLALIGLLLCLVFSLSATVMVQGQGQPKIEVSQSQAVMDFPLYLNFSADIESSNTVEDIRLRYKIDQLSFAEVVSEVFVTFNPSTSVQAEYTLDMRKVGGLPPGTNVSYWWKVTDSTGYSVETDASNYQIVDNRFDWDELSEGKINIYWYEGDQSFADSLMSTAQEALVYLKNNTGAEPDKTINIYIYNGSGDLQGSMIYPQEWTGGVAYTNYNIIAIGITPDILAWGQGAMTHELTHNVINQVVHNPYSDVPVWLNEGLAMYSEGLLSPQFTTPLSQAVKNDSLFTVRSLCSPFSALTDKASLSYAESYSMVDYLTGEYGSEKMLELLNTFKAGSTYDDAFIKVYGFDIEGLNDLWLDWVKDQYSN